MANNESNSINQQHLLSAFLIMDSPSAYGTLSAFPVEIRRQVWHELLCEPVAILTPLWVLRSRDGLYYVKIPERTPVDVAIFRSSQACGVEAMEVFYSEHTFSFCALPSLWELECMDINYSLRVAQFITDFKTRMPSYPTQLAARHIRDVRMSISIPRSNGCFGSYQTSDHSLCIALMHKLQASGKARKTCSIDLLFFGIDKCPEIIEVLGPPFFRAFKTLTAFNKVTINSSGFPRPAYLTFNPDKSYASRLDCYKNTALICYVMQRIVEELEPALGPATVLDGSYTHIAEFRPRIRPAESGKAGTILTVQTNMGNRGIGLKSLIERLGRHQAMRTSEWGLFPCGRRAMSDGVFTIWSYSKETIAAAISRIMN